MRIALIPSAYAPSLGGVEELTFRLAKRYLSAGDDVEVWTNRHPASLDPTSEIEGIRVRRFPLFLPPLRPKEIAQFGYRGPSALAEMRRATRQFRPDVLHVQCFSVNGAYAAALSTLERLPLFVTLQGETVMDDANIYERSIAMRSALRLGLRRASAVSACSAFVLEDARKRFGLGAGKGEVIPNGVEAEDTQATPFPVPFERFVFAVGRVVRKKGFDLLIDAFAERGQEPGLGLVIGGDGPELEALRGHARDRGLANDVHFPGRLSRGQVSWAMEQAEVFVLPSRIEPFGIVVVEAMRAGRPVIVSSRGGAGEIVRDGVEGLVVDPCDTAAMSGALDRLVGDGELRERFSAAARVRAQAFKWSDIATTYRDRYAQIMVARR